MGLKCGVSCFIVSHVTIILLLLLLWQLLRCVQQRNLHPFLPLILGSAPCGRHYRRVLWEAPGLLDPTLRSLLVATLIVNSNFIRLDKRGRWPSIKGGSSLAARHSVTACRMCLVLINLNRRFAIVQVLHHVLVIAKLVH